MADTVQAAVEMFSEPGDVHKAGVRLLSFDTTGRIMASGDLEMGFAIWRDGFLTSHLDLTTLDAADKYADRIHAAVFSADSSRIYVACSSEVLAIEAADGRLAWVYQTARVFGFLRSTPLAIAVMPDGGLVVSSTSGDLDIVDSEGRLQARWRDSSAPQSMGLLADGDTLIGVDGHVMQTWSIGQRRRIERIPDGEDAIALTLATDGSFAILRRDGEYVRYDVLKKTFGPSVPIAPSVPSLAIRHDGREVAFVEDDGLTRTTPELRRIDRLEPPDSPAICATYDPQSGNVLAGTRNGGILTWLT